MRNILFISSSLSGAASVSREVADELVQSMLAAHPGAAVTERKLTSETMPHLDGATLNALGTAAEQRSPEQADKIAFADRLIEEVEEADTIVLAAPMYNFSIPSTLKAWIDYVARAGRTFRYTAEGPKGLLTGKKVYLVLARGGVYSQGPATAFDFQETYLRAVLGFIGITDVTVVHAEGLNISPEAKTAGRKRAKETVATLFPTPVAA